MTNPHHNCRFAANRLEILIDYREKSSGLPDALVDAGFETSIVKQQADWISDACGGAGAAREATDFILRSQDLLDDKQASYLR